MNNLGIISTSSKAAFPTKKSRSDLGRNFDAWVSAAGNWLPLLAIILFTMVLRLPEIGNPAPDFDEQLYFLVGDRMWNGAIPFVDIWDRKPIGLFLIYAATRLLGGDGIVQYQLVAAMFVAATAWMVYLITIRLTGWKGALSAALIFTLYLRGLFSAAGQSESFLMLFCVGAMLLAVKSIETDDSRTVRKYAFAAMLLMGIALQVKYTVLPQCIFFGLFFSWRIASVKSYWISVRKYIPIFIVIGLIPTISVGVYYHLIGHFKDFYYANFTSIFDRGRLTGDILDFCIKYSLVVLTPLIMVAMTGLIDQFRNLNKVTALTLTSAWALFCVFGIVMTGSVYVHYFIPVVPALSIMAGTFIGQRTVRLIALVGLILYVGKITDYPGAFKKNSTDTASIQRLTEIATPHMSKGCIYVYDGPTILYATTKSCLPTRRPYPDHLNNLQEKYSMGLNQASEVARVLASRPVAIFTASEKVVPQLSKKPAELVRASIRANYRFVARVRYDRRTINMYLRNDLKNQSNF
jgi:Dolichyl-phosphate-mannose-protein mannosyltransferase